MATSYNPDLEATEDGPSVGKILEELAGPNSEVNDSLHTERQHVPDLDVKIENCSNIGNTSIYTDVSEHFKLNPVTNWAPESELVDT